jgi:hypothetical protein
MDELAPGAANDRPSPVFFAGSQIVVTEDIEKKIVRNGLMAGSAGKGLAEFPSQEGRQLIETAGAGGRYGGDTGKTDDGGHGWLQ